MLDGVKALTEAILLITAADLLEGLTSWLTGGSSLSAFAGELVPFGEAMMKFSNSIAGLDGNLVSTAAIAGRHWPKWRRPAELRRHRGFSPAK